MAAITVFCSASASAVALFSKETLVLATGIAKAGWELIYGGSHLGLMGTLADAALKEGGVVRGVMPKVLAEKEAAHMGLTELIYVADMHERKKTMLDKGNALVVLPGGLGTLDEMIEALTWKQLDIHNKEIILLNIDGFWDGFLSHLNSLKKQSLLHGRDDLFTVARTSTDALIRLRAVVR